ncbi:hypothetical protein CHS0354_001532 [Potamilus streckersoni]|uniref:Uncharacterized protein n=1 Tax=Potamilus streckersoni TaxID=2493646 RepID=A0AAE0SN33_9BIVA|nr:hypothetical protein CHS0354_001532 [Potamilus streckersoni]
MKQKKGPECSGYMKQQTSQGKVSVNGDNYEYFECCASSLCNEHTVIPSPANCKPVPQVTTPKH